MGKIIQLKDYTGRRDGTMKDNATKFKKLLENLKTRNAAGKEYSLGDIIDVANQILQQIDYYSGCGATPIVKIAKEFDFKTYKETLNNNKSGDIHINGATQERYGHNQVILVNKTEEFFHQRFVVAHELAHYLFDFLGNTHYEDKNILFFDSYTKDQHDTPEEKRANAFAAEIMMPRELFIEQYHTAKQVDNSRMFILLYLSRFFETSIESIEKRIVEVSGVNVVF